MLSAAAYSFRQKSRLAISLSWIAGYTNVVTFLVCGGIVVSHTTGNVTHFAEALAYGRWLPTFYFLFVVTSFFAGAVTSAVMTEVARRRGLASKYILPIALEAVLLCAMAIWIRLQPSIDWNEAVAGSTTTGLWTLCWLTGLGSFAMGLQNATITRVSGAVVRTTHLTGVVTDLGLEGVQLLLWYRDRTRSKRSQRAGRVLRVSVRHPTVLRVLLLASILGSFIFGAIAGTLAYRWVPALALLAPVSFLLAIILIDWRKPIADVRELDPTTDSELRAAGIVKSLLPTELGIYRLFHRRNNAMHHAPDFQSWADRLPAHWRVIIVAVSPLTHFDVDEAMGLRAAIERLKVDGRRLVVCGLTRQHYKVFDDAGVTQVLRSEDLCPDLEFAIARGIDLLESSAHVARLRT